MAGRVFENLEAAAREVERLQAMIAAQNKANNLPIKIAPKSGAVSVYGLGRWPVTLYAGQWKRLLASAEQILAFIEAHADEVSDKDKDKASNGAA